MYASTSTPVPSIFLVFGIFFDVLFDVERNGLRAVTHASIGHQDLDPTLGVLERRGTLARELHTGFEEFERLFEGHLSLLEPSHRTLEPLERRLE
jgi:hypothetical protein